MKFDKDALLKQKFWIGLLVNVPLTLGAIFVLWSVVSGQISAERQKIEKAASTPTGTNLANDDTNKKLQEKADELKKKETVAWEESFKAQESLFTWPGPVEERFKFNSGKFTTEMKVIDPRPEKGQAPANSANQFYGTVVDVDKDKAIVRSDDGKEETFFRTPKFKVALKEGPMPFNHIPKGQFVSVSFHRWKYFMDPLTDSERIEFKRSYLPNNNGTNQVATILAQVDPMDASGKGVVQFKGWMPAKKGDIPPGPTSFLTFKSDDWLDAHDFSEEAWLAQEDIWIQREIYRLIRLANDSVGKCEGKGGDGLDKTFAFSNPYFELTMKLAASDKLEVEIKNRLNRRQRLDIHFMVRFHKSFDPEKVMVGGEPLEPNDPNVKNANVSRKVTVDLPKLPRTGIYAVEQVLTWETAAVKRIDNIKYGLAAAHGHRTIVQGIRALKDEEKKDVPEAKDAKVPMGPGPGVQGADAGVALPNGFDRKRYCEVTEQYRRMPLAVSLIVDQDHLDRVQTAFNNSRFRFLTTQVLLNRYSGTLRPMLAAPGAVGPAGGIDPMPLGVPMQPGVNPNPAASQDASDLLESNFEMVIYGMIAIYERYPPKPGEKGPEEAKK